MSTISAVTLGMFPPPKDKVVQYRCSYCAMLPSSECKDVVTKSAKFILQSPLMSPATMVSQMGWPEESWNHLQTDMLLLAKPVLGKLTQIGPGYPAVAG